MFELGFSPEFFFAESEPYDGGYGVQEEPWSVWMAIHAMSEEDYARMAYEVFGESDPKMVTPEMVMDKIRKTDGCANLTVPVEVYIDSGGWHSVFVYDKPEESEDED
jgi:hypothetical protein